MTTQIPSSGQASVEMAARLAATPKSASVQPTADSAAQLQAKKKELESRAVAATPVNTKKNYIPVALVTSLVKTGALKTVATQAKTSATTTATTTTPASTNNTGAGRNPVLPPSTVSSLAAALRGPVSSGASLSATSVMAGMRFGYGLTQNDVNNIRTQGAMNWLTNQVNTPLTDVGPGLEGVRENWVKYSQSGVAWPFLAEMQNYWKDQVTLRYYQTMTTTNPFMARMARFWDMHFGIKGRIAGDSPFWLDVMKGVIPLGFFKDVCLRYVQGSFADMLVAASENMAMLNHLNGTYSATIPTSALYTDPNRAWWTPNMNPNQNYPRELMQIHSLSDDERAYKFPVANNLISPSVYDMVFGSHTNTSQFMEPATTGGQRLRMYNQNDIQKVAIVLPTT